MAGGLAGEFRFGANSERREDAPTLRIVVLADLGGRTGRIAETPRPPIAQRPLVHVDVDTFGEVLAQIAPRLEIRVGGPDSPLVPMVFRSLEDFHPDSLYRRLEPFSRLRDIRRRLLDTSTFAQAA